MIIICYRMKTIFSYFLVNNLLIQISLTHYRLHILIIASDRPVLVHLVGKGVLQLHQHVHLKLPVRVDLALDLLVLGQGLLNAVLRVQLRILPVVDVVKDLKRDMHVLHLALYFIDFLQSGDQAVSVSR